MESSAGIEEQKLLTEPKYRVYMSNIDKALKNFEYSSEWADLISALGKLTKAICNNTQYQIIPRRIKISKRLAQCMHPALPSGVHLKALETYDVIFSKTGPERLATELFIYSSGLFPLLGYAAMNIRPILLGIYEKYFVPLGERLRPALSGFLSGVLPGYESGLDYFDRTNSLLSQVCTAVNPSYFYTCLWECVATNASIRLPAVSYLLDHFNKRLLMQEQMSIMGKNHDVLMAGLCACLNDPVILVQRNTLEFLLLGFPLHTTLLSKSDFIKLVTNGLNTILRRDMSLNRRLYSWLLGSEVTNRSLPTPSAVEGTTEPKPAPTQSYFEQHSKQVLIKAIRCTLKISLQYDPVDLKPYRILVSLLDKVEIGPAVLDHVLCDVIRAMSESNGNMEVIKSANLLFATFDPSYIWNFMTQQYEKSCKGADDIDKTTTNRPMNTHKKKLINEVDSGPPCLIEVCQLTEYLLETISLEMYNETTRIYLPRVFLSITQMLTIYSGNFTADEITASLQLCMKIVSRVQPMITSPAKTSHKNKRSDSDDTAKTATFGEGVSLEKSKSDSKINQTALDDEPIRRSNSNQNMVKRSPKKTKKSKSYSKLLELDKEIFPDDTGQTIPSAISTPELDGPNNAKKSKSKRFSPSMKLKNFRGKSSKIEENKLENSAIEIEEAMEIKPMENDMSLNLLNPSIETTIQEYSILEKCIKQYEIFFQVYLSQQVLSVQVTPSKIPKCSVVVSVPATDQRLSTDSADSSGSNNFEGTDEVIEDDSIERVQQIDNMFETLKLTEQDRTIHLENLLQKTISSVTKPDSNDDCSDNDYKDCLSDIEKWETPMKSKSFNKDTERAIHKLMNIKLSETLRNSVKLAANLLVEMSTFPNYDQNLTLINADFNLPPWLKVLSLIACYTKTDKELQISAISTLFELISLLKSQLEHSTNPGVTFVVMLPLLKFGHVTYLENRTRVIQVITSSLWDHLGDKTTDPSQITSLLYELHNCLDSGIVETVIGYRIANAHIDWSDVEYAQERDRQVSSLKSKSIVLNLMPPKPNRLITYKNYRLADKKVMCTPPIYTIFDCNEHLTESEAVRFRKFELIWDHGRESQQTSRGFEATALKMFDNLSLPYHISLRTFVAKWLQESLLRGDLSRLIFPLMNMLLATNTKRISILHAHLLRKDGYSSDSMQERTDGRTNENVPEKDVYAISSEEGTIKYHMDLARNKKRSPIRSLQKKFFGVTIGSKNKTSNYISEKMVASPSASDVNISLIINPMDNSSDMDGVESENYSLSSSLPTKIANGSEDFNPSIESVPNITEATANPTKSEEYSSCEDETDESYSDTESEMREESMEKDASLLSVTNTNTIKRFSGNCDSVTDVLTEHDRTKNRKTYQVTKTLNGNANNTSTGVIEKLEMSFASVSEGINIKLEESTPAEEYIYTTATAPGDTVVETFINDLISQASEYCDKYPDQENNCENVDNSDFDEENANLRNLEMNGHKKEDIDNSHFKKRLSNTSKASSDSSASVPSRELNKSAAIEAYDSDRDSGRDSQKSDRDAGTADSENEKKPEPIPLTQEKTDWNKAQESMENSKKNVEILRQNALEGNSKYFKRRISMDNKRHSDRIHPFHTHMLLYYGVYDTKQVLYAFQTLRNIIACDCRTFLCLSTTTSITNSPIKQQLVRHRKSVFGKGFSGTIINTEFSHAYRGCMYLEALVTLCLYYARSFFQKECAEMSKLPSSEDINGNCKIQLASIELLTMLCSEMISIVKDMGKGLACYIGDLMAKCKLQKIILHCLISSVHLFNTKFDLSYSEQINAFNELSDEKLHAEAVQLQLLRLLMSVIKLEFEVSNQKGDDGAPPVGMGNTISNSIVNINKSVAQVLPYTNSNNMDSPILSNSTASANVKYLPNSPISQQPLFLSAVLKALQANHLRHLHQNWTGLITASLNCFTFGSLTNIVISVVHQLCGNIDKISKNSKSVYISPDYGVSQLEAVTVLCHYCLLDTTQQTSLTHLFNQSYPQTSAAAQSSNTGQLLNNIVHAILSTPQSNENQARHSQIMAARNAVLSHLPVIVASIARLWDADLGQTRQVKQQILEFLSPVSLHHGTNFLAAVAVTWQERGEMSRRDSIGNASIASEHSSDSSSRKSSIIDLSNSNCKSLPQACPEQLSLVKLVSSIRVMPMDSFVQTLHQVVKYPPNIHHPPVGLSIEVSALELFYFYMKSASAPQLGDCWSSLLALLRDGISLQPPAQFVILAILSEYVQRCPQMPFQDKKDLRDLHDVTARLVEALSNVAGACLEQTTWLRRNLAVKEDYADGTGSIRDASNQLSGIQQYSVQAQSVMAAVLANLLDVAFGSQEKDKVVTIVTTLMYNITPYLKNHTARNIPSFFACSNLLANLSGYQYTRKAWRKDMLDLLLDPAFFQMDISCLPFWKSILDSLMTYDNTTFRELMGRVSLTQTGGLNIFVSRDQEYEQRAVLLKRLAFVIFCSEQDQYHKYMPEIQEQLANSLRLPSVVPSVQAAVFLCFRVLLLRISPDHVTSLWPTIIAEMVQVFLAIEQELKADNDEFSQQIRIISGMDSPWANPSNGVINPTHLTQWRMVQLEATKLLELGCVLPATNLPHFQMYRWAFVGSQYDTCGIGDITNGHAMTDADAWSPTSSSFIPHVRRITRLMDLRFTTHSPKQRFTKGKYLTLTCQSIANLQDLYVFFATLGAVWPMHDYDSVEKNVTECLAEIETILSADFLEKMPSTPSR